MATALMINLDTIQGQQDSVIIEYESKPLEQLDSADVRHGWDRNPFGNNMEDMISAFSVGLSFSYDKTNSNDILAPGLGLSYERKLGKSFSILLKNTTYYINLSLDIPKLMKNISSSEIRYYFLQKRMVGQGKSGNNFSGGFLGVGYSFTYDQHMPVTSGNFKDGIWDFDKGMWRIDAKGYNKKEIYHRINLNAGYRYMFAVGLYTEVGVNIKLLDIKHRINYKESYNFYIKIGYTF